MSVNNLVSKINIFDDIIKLAGEIIEFCQDFPNDDEIIKICLDKEGDEPIHVIAGSKAIVTFLELLRESQKKAIDNNNKGCGPYLRLVDHFKSEDTDVFFLGNNNFERLKIENIDIVHHKAKNVSELLGMFDLPCCLTAMNVEKDTFWVSLQCLYSMLTGTYYLPKYFNNYDLFMRKYSDVNNDLTQIEHPEVIYGKIHKRISKYEQKGYTVKYFDSDQTLSFIIASNSNSYY